MQNWTRAEYFADTGLPLDQRPAPTSAAPTAAILYPALGLIETANVSVGRGTEHPFSFFGAFLATRRPPTSRGSTAASPPIDAAQHPGVTFTVQHTEPIAEDANHYPFHGQTIPAVRVICHRPTALDSPELGLEILSALHHLYPTQFHLDKAMTLICQRSATMAAIDIRPRPPLPLPPPGSDAARSKTSAPPPHPTSVNFLRSLLAPAHKSLQLLAKRKAMHQS